MALFLLSPRNRPPGAAHGLIVASCCFICRTWLIYQRKSYMYYQGISLRCRPRWSILTVVHHLVARTRSKICVLKRFCLVRCHRAHVHTPTFCSPLRMGLCGGAPAPGLPAWAARCCVTKQDEIQSSMSESDAIQSCSDVGPCFTANFFLINKKSTF